MITVILPSILNRPETGGDVLVDEPVATIGDLVGALEARYPGIAAEIDDAIFNFAVNGRMILHRVRQEPLTDGDTVEIVPTISGGQPRSARSASRISWRVSANGSAASA